MSSFAKNQRIDKVVPLYFLGRPAKTLPKKNTINPKNQENILLLRQPTANLSQKKIDKTLGIALLRSNQVNSSTILQALYAQDRHNESLEDILLSRKVFYDPLLHKALANHWGLQTIESKDIIASPQLVDLLGVSFCLRHKIIPIKRIGGAVLVALAKPSSIKELRVFLSKKLGSIAFVMATQSDIDQAVLSLYGSKLAYKAETKVSPFESCRDLVNRRLLFWLTAILAGVMAFLWLAPAILLTGVTLWAALTLALSNGLKITASIASSLTPKATPLPRKAQLKSVPKLPTPKFKPKAEPSNLKEARAYFQTHSFQKLPSTLQQNPLPIVTIIVALYQESDIATRLIKRLSRIDYPKGCLDIIIAVESDDTTTKKTLSQVDLPVWMRVVHVPEGQLKTKPRALNFALNYAKGAIIGVYDAEDAPEAQQIKKIVSRFNQRPPEVACLQGILDFYNPSTNWLSRCFTLEYAVWFRLILPGLQKLNLAIPLGGTTIFFRREALEKIGAWDAHNVTEDADLGIRLARYGYRTEMIDSVTEEEANCRPLAWVKQRSRWIKGYIMTWTVHMRSPLLLYHQLGFRRFLGFQITFLCTISQFLLAPVLWSFWLVPFGLYHPVVNILPKSAMILLIALFLTTEVLNITFSILAIKKTSHHMSKWWVLTLHFYFPLAAIASYKAAWEIITKPFYWDKTSHGKFSPIYKV